MPPAFRRRTATLATLIWLASAAIASAAAPYDDFGSAAPVGPAIGGSNVGATGESGEPNHAGVSLRPDCTGPIAPDPGCLTSVWGVWTAAPAGSGPTGEVTVETCGSNFNTTLAIYQGSSLGSLTLVAANDDGGTTGTTCPENPRASSVTFNAAPSGRYIGALSGFHAAAGEFSGHRYPGPDTQIDSGPAFGSTASTGTTTFAFSSTSTFPSTFECSVDFNTFTPCASPFVAAGLPNGVHNFLVRATANGNTDVAPAVVRFTVKDHTPPAITGYVLGSKRFRAAAKGGSFATSVGTRVSFTVSEPALMTFRVQRVMAGRRLGRRCVVPRPSTRRRRRCLRLVPAGGFTTRRSAGANRLRFTGRLRGRRLAPGPYALMLTATDAADNVSRASSRPFRIVTR